MFSSEPPVPHAARAHLAAAETSVPLPVRLTQRQRFSFGQSEPIGLDQVALEEPLEIRIQGYPLAVVMRSPGHDEELVTGFIISEMIAKAEHILRVKHCDIGDVSDNVMQVTLDPASNFDPARFARHSFVSSSCGVCGKRSIEQALMVAAPLTAEGRSPEPRHLSRACANLRRFQPGYQACGGLHAAGLMGPDGELLAVYEDIGRHNAVDKVIGWAASHHYSLMDHALIVSGRASFEIVQKALAARISTIAAVGGVSSLAVDLAARAHIKLFGFVSETVANAYFTEAK